ncbi:V-type ATP synthase subunit I [Natronorarus salvus]|uniref:V-type ATP synthase subunit I n=1 Tax=Natronorarus salvus TaxID=3117733 RepID=UPI002F269F53
MLRPEQMSKVSVVGSTAVMERVIETVHDLRLVHLADYDDSWEDFSPGTPIEGSESLSEQLVTVRSIESILDVEEEDAGPSRVIDEGDLDDEIERTRTRVNELDDRRADLREELRRVEDRISSVRPFARLGIDLDLLSGYDSIDTGVYRARPAEVEAALAESEEVEEFETFSEGDVVAVFATPGREGVIADALVGVEVSALSVPEAETSPGAYVEELEHRRHQLDSKLTGVENELEEVKLDVAGFLLAVEEQLTIDVQKKEVPLSFATTERSFVAEGWVPTERYPELEVALTDAVGDRVVVEELERMDYDGHAESVAAPEGGTIGEPTGTPAATDGGKRKREARPDGGEETTMHDEKPPVVLDNPGTAKPFELLVNLVGKPKYTELDPTLLVFLTYPLAFGFMIGDIGYGLLYVAMGAFLLRYDSEAMQALGWIAVWAGAFTTLFGYLYDDVFGVHMADVGLGFLPLAGVLTKGLQTTEWALLWIVVSMLFGIVHLNIGLIMGFINEMGHGAKAAVLERGSWILLMNGLFAWIFSLHLVGEKPEFLVGTESVLYEFLGFAGLPEVVGLVGLAAAAVGFVMVGVGEGAAGLAETPAWAFGHVLSYLRMVAVLLAKGGMAFAVNVLVFGSYPDNGYVYFGLPGTGVADPANADFPGLVWIGVESGSILVLAVAVVAAIAVFVLGHILVLLLGITAAGIQMIRLEYVEFFQKFYEGGGEEYEPFGYERTHTTE